MYSHHPFWVIIEFGTFDIVFLLCSNSMKEHFLIAKGACTRTRAIVLCFRITAIKETYNLIKINK